MIQTPIAQNRFYVSINSNKICVLYGLKFCFFCHQNNPSITMKSYISLNATLTRFSKYCFIFPRWKSKKIINVNPRICSPLKNGTKRFRYNHLRRRNWFTYNHSWYPNSFSMISQPFVPLFLNTCFTARGNSRRLPLIVQIYRFKTNRAWGWN